MKLNIGALGRLALGTAVLLGGPAWAQDDRPNIVLIVADDLGYSDISSFGGEIATPNLDALAAEGVQLTNFHVGPTCSPTRSMLMSGTDNHVAGLGSMAEEILDEQRGHPGYEGYLNERVMSFPQPLRDAGYHTYMTGKWHLGGKEDQRPNARGFEKSFANLGAGAHFFDQTGLLGMFPKANYTQDDVPINLPADFGYATNYFTDRMIDYIATGEDDEPFFAYLAYTAPHWPLQAPDADIALFKGKYDRGYGATRDARLARMADMGVIPAGTTQNLAPDLWPHWDELDPDQRAVEARKMEVYAAMVHNLDQNVGRLVSSLKQSGEYENTVFIFFSDNGAEGSLPDSIQGGKNRIWIEENFDNSLENMGKQGSYFGYGPSWAAVSQTPFRMMKGHVYEGGVRAPAFITMPEGQGGGRSDQFIHVTDIAPTLLDIAGIEPPREHDGIALAEPAGHSLLPWLQRDTEVARPQDQPVCTELFGRASVWKDNWKLVHENQPWGTGGYELFDLRHDLAEANDLAAARPEKLAELQADWADCQAGSGIYWNEGLAPQMVYGNESEYLFRRPHANN